MHRSGRRSLFILAIVSILALVATSCAGSDTAISPSVSQSLTTIVNPLESSGTSNAPSVYDGTYSGTFNYEYETVTWDADKDLPGNEIISWWIPATIGITLTFETSSLSISPDWVELKIIHVICDDPVFGTSENGIIPDDSNGLTAYAYFPIPPNKVLGPSEGIKLVINFPNGGYLHSIQGVTNRGTFYASPDGTRLSYIYRFTGSEDYGLGAFYGNAAIGPFSPMKDYPDYFIRTESWTLIKVAP
jgi:hypothetical protein